MQLQPNCLLDRPIHLNLLVLELFQSSSNCIIFRVYQSSWIYQFQSSSSAVPTVLSSGCNNPVESTSFRAISEQLQSSSNCILFWMQSSSWNCQFQGSSRAIPIRLICGSNQIESTKIQLNLPVSEQFQNSSRAVLEQFQLYCFLVIAIQLNLPVSGQFQSIPSAAPTRLTPGYSNPVESTTFRAVLVQLQPDCILCVAIQWNPPVSERFQSSPSGL